MRIPALSLTLSSLILLHSGNGYAVGNSVPEESQSTDTSTPTKSGLVKSLPIMNPLPKDDVPKTSNHKGVRVGRLSSGLVEVNEVKKEMLRPPYWLGDPALRHGSMPHTAEGYKFFRNVKDYGAVGDGVTDDTAAINRAVGKDDPNRCTWDCGSSTVKGAVVYFPSGTYLITGTILQPYYTEFKGDPVKKPTIKAAADFNVKDHIMIDTNPYREARYPNMAGESMFIPQNQFFRSIENLRIDGSDWKPTYSENGRLKSPKLLHWHVSQSTHLRNVEIIMNKHLENNVGQTGIFTEDGSGGFVSDVTVTGGDVGWDFGSQQYTIRNMTFRDCQTAIKGVWNWGVTLKNINVYNATIGINAAPKADEDMEGQNDFSLALLDSNFTNVDTVLIVQDKTAQGKRPPSIYIAGLWYLNVGTVVKDTTGLVLRKSDCVVDCGHECLCHDKLPWVFGQVTHGQGLEALFGSQQDDLKRKIQDPPQALLQNGEHGIFEQPKPLYKDVQISEIINILDHGAQNNGESDQTHVLNSILRENVGKIIFFPAGVYTVHSTLEIPVGSKIIGEGWPAIMATGPYFADALNPKVMVQVGKPGDIGSMEISNMLYTTRGPTAGAILVEWNVKAESQGSAAMWDSHFRVGGALGTDLQKEQCGTDFEHKKDCLAANTLFHITKDGNGYFENVWAWTADHDLDKPIARDTTLTANGKNLINISVGRGIVIESQGPTWLHGTASEHNILSQYSVIGAKDLYMGSIQAESAYCQPFYNEHAEAVYTTQAQWDLSKSLGLGLDISSSENVYIAGVGLYSFYFNNTSEEEFGTHFYHQPDIINVQDSKNIRLANIYTRGSMNVLPGLRANEVQEQGSTMLSLAVF